MMWLVKSKVWRLFESWRGQNVFGPCTSQTLGPPHGVVLNGQQAFIANQVGYTHDLERPEAQGADIIST